MSQLIAVTVERTQSTVVILSVPEGYRVEENLAPEDLLRACQTTVREDQWETEG